MIQVGHSTEEEHKKITDGKQASTVQKTYSE